MSRMTPGNGTYPAKAINSYDRAVKVLSETRNPFQWAGGKTDMALAFLALDEAASNPSIRIASLKMSLAATKEALRIFRRNEFPRQWAVTKITAAEAAWRLMGFGQQRCRDNNIRTRPATFLER